MNSDTYYIIWSNEHKAWWRPGRCGYTNNRSEAGIYPAKEAFQIVSNANCWVPLHLPPQETLLPVTNPTA